MLYNLREFTWERQFKKKEQEEEEEDEDDEEEVKHKQVMSPDGTDCVKL